MFALAGCVADDESADERAAGTDDEPKPQESIDAEPSDLYPDVADFPPDWRQFGADEDEGEIYFTHPDNKQFQLEIEVFDTEADARAAFDAARDEHADRSLRDPDIGDAAFGFMRTEDALEMWVRVINIVMFVRFVDRIGLSHEEDAVDLTEIVIGGF